jgi:hypothetical protein
MACCVIRLKTSTLHRHGCINKDIGALHRQSCIKDISALQGQSGSNCTDTLRAVHIQRTESEQLFHSANHFRRVRINSEENLSASSCLSVRLPLRPSAGKHRMFVTFYIGSFNENVSKSSKLVKIWHLHEDVSRFILLTQVGNVLQLDNRENGNHPCVSTATLTPCVLLHCWQQYVGPQH